MNNPQKRTIGIGIITLGMILVLATGAMGQVFVPRVTEERVAFHSVDVFIKEDGSASIEERFFFSFFADEADQFEKDFVENTPSLAAWKEDYPFIKPYMGLETQIEGAEFLLNQTPNGEPALSLTYQYPTGLVQQLRVDTGGRSTRWKLSDAALVSFISGGNIHIQDTTQIKLHLPADAVVDTVLLPEGVTSSGGVVTITNFKGNSLRVEYTTTTPIASPVDLGKILEAFIQSPFFIVFIALFGLVGLYVALNKERLTGKIEDYIVEHSEFRTNNNHQDVDEDLESEGSA